MAHRNLIKTIHSLLRTIEANAQDARQEHDLATLTGRNELESVADDLAGDIQRVRELLTELGEAQTAAISLDITLDAAPRDAAPAAFLDYSDPRVADDGLARERDANGHVKVPTRCHCGHSTCPDCAVAR